MLTNSAVCKTVPGPPATAKTFASDVSSAFAAGGTVLTEPTASITSSP